MKRFILLAIVLILVGFGGAFLVSGLRQNTATETPVEIDITTSEESITQQTAVQRGPQEGDEALYNAYVQQLTLGRLGREQPSVNSDGRVVYEQGDQLTYNLLTAEGVEAPFTVTYEIVSEAGVRETLGEPLELNPGSNATCCIAIPEVPGEYTLRFFIDDTQFAARYFTVR